MVERAMWLGVAVLAAMAAVASAEEEHKVSHTSMVVCLMLMGTVGSTMGAFYLVNHSDKDIKTSTWKIICNTISIFAAVLLFQAVNGMVAYLFLEKATLFVKVVVSFVHSGTWFAVLQVFLACVSRSIKTPRCLLKPMPEEEGEEREDLMETIRLDMKCWGILFGHIAGFASINAWCVVQQFFHESLIGSALVIVGAAVSLWLTFLITDMCREHIAMADDGEKDACEELWDESVEETEEDVRALTLSFLTVQWLRFAVFGVLPSAEGDMPDLPYTHTQMFSMLGVALFIVVYNNLPGRYCCKQRLLGKGMTVRTILNLVFAWSIMYTFRIWLLTEKYLHGDASGEVAQAVIVTWGTFAAQHFLDYLADLDSTGKETDDAIRSIISTLAILVGFSWEKCFDVAVDNIAEKIEGVPEAMTKLLLALVLASSVLPAWRWYILPVLDRLGGFEEEEEEEEEEGGDEEKGGEGKEGKEAASEGYKPLADGSKEAPRSVEPLGAPAPPAVAAASEAEVMALRKQAQAAAIELQGVQQNLRSATLLNQQQEARIQGALQAEQDQRTRVFQLEAEKSQLEAQLQEVSAQRDAVMQGKADDGQLAARLGDMQAKFEVAVKGQAACQAENSQLCLQIKDLVSQLEMAKSSHAACQAENEGRIAVMTSQIESYMKDKARIRDLEGMVEADAERKASLEALVESLNRSNEDLRVKAARLDPTVNDELTRTIAGPPVQPSGSSGDFAAAMAPPLQSQASPPLEPINAAASAGPRITGSGSSGVVAAAVPTAGVAPQLLSSTRSPPKSPGAVPKGQPVSPTGGRLSASETAKAPNRKPPALQPGQAPAAPRLAQSDAHAAEIPRGGGVPGQRVVMPSMGSRGASSKEAVYPISSMQQQPPRRF